MDNFIVSARKYRPDAFSSVIGQESITQTLKNSITGKQLAHAYLFCGPRGVGKTTCARIFAKIINCQNSTSETEPCNECESCTAFNKSGSFNIHELDGASNNSVEDIRSLIDQVRIPPQVGHYSVYIIDEVHMLSQSAFNAFLKTLEEPPAHAIFILATTEKHKILPTILSRCQVYDFNRISVNDIVKRLEFVANQENISIDSDALNVIAQKADGALRDALSIFDQIVSFSGTQVTYEQVLKNLNVLDYDYFFKITDYLLKGQVSELLMILDDILLHGFDAQYFISGLIKHIRDLLICRVPKTIELLEVGDNIREKYLFQSQHTSVAFLYNALDIATQCDIQYKAASGKRLLVELTLIKIAGIASVEPNGGITQTNKTTQEINSKTNSVTTEANKNTASQQVAKEQASNYQTSSPQETPEPQKSVVPETSFKPEIATFSIKKPVANKSEEKADTEEKKTADLITLTNENLDKCWKKLAVADKEQFPTLAVTLQNTTPAIEPDGKINIVIENEYQKNEFIRNLDRIRLFLRSELGPHSFDFTFELVEPTDTKNMYYTDSDKIKYLSEKYSHFDTFRKRFGLDVS
ncbi:MAG: DNA polymerase III subunit gamma/tau [Bacteroidetes bacterium HGW-Bacteroidetes-21]|nr:MAG: DNA polymerase III subunit gamma/tau [Bacteroidetes bacterium HGW-Bacteroidetes-21]